MKKALVLVLILTMIFSVFSMGAAAKGVTIKENAVPLAGGAFFAADEDEAKTVNPKTDDGMLFVIIIAGISLTAAGIMKKSRAK